MPLKPADHQEAPVNKEKKSKKWLIIIVVIAAIIIAGGIWIFSVMGNVDNSSAMKAEKVDYLIKVNDGEETEFILLRARSNGKITEILIPLNSSVDGEEDVVYPDNLAQTLTTLNSWFGINTDEIYFAEMNEEILKDLSSKLGKESESFSAFIDSLAGRGFGFFDYFKINSYLDSFDSSTSTNLDSGSLANFISKMSNSIAHV